MNTTHNTKTKRLRLAAVAVATPALLFAGAGTAHADPCIDGSLAGSYYCSPAGGGLSPGGPDYSQNPFPREPGFGEAIQNPIIQGPIDENYRGNPDAPQPFGPVIEFEWPWE